MDAKSFRRLCAALGGLTGPQLKELWTALRSLDGRMQAITPEALDAFAAGDHMRLHRALGLRPWQPSPLEADTPEPPCDMPGGPWAEAWPLAFDLRGKLERGN